MALDGDAAPRLACAEAILAGRAEAVEQERSRASPPACAPRPATRCGRRSPSASPSQCS